MEPLQWVPLNADHQEDSLVKEIADEKSEK